MQLRGALLDQLPHRELLAPLRGNPVGSVVRARDLAVDRAGRVRVLAEIHDRDRAVAEVVGGVERPQRGFERVDDVATAADRGRLPHFERPAGDLFHLRGERIRQPALHRGLVLVAQDVTLRHAGERREEQTREVPARVHTLDRRVRGPRTIARESDRLCGVARERQWRGCEPHERAVAGRVRTRVAAERLAGADEAIQCAARGRPDVETAPLHAEVTVPIPPHVGFELMNRIEAALGDEALRKAQCHRRVVRPFPRLQAERPATDHVGERDEVAGVRELQRRAESVTRGQPEECAAIAVERRHGRRSGMVVNPEP